MAPRWKHIALELDIAEEAIETINVNHPTVYDKYYYVFSTWLKKFPDNTLCWCQIVNAVKMAGLVDVAEQIKESHLGKLINNNIVYHESSKHFCTGIKFLK